MRLLFITNEFPNSYQPTKGLFNLYLARALGQEHELRVVSPISWVEEWGARRRGMRALDSSRTAVLDGVEVHYPRYYYPPKVLRQCYGRLYWRSVRATVWHLLQEQLPDAVLSYWLYPDGYVASRVARLLGVPMAVIAGGSDVLLLPRQRGWRRSIVDVLQQADVVLTVSQHLKEAVTGLGVGPEKVCVWNQGVDVGLFRPGDQRESRRRLGIPSYEKMLLWVGRMHPVKGLDVLFDSCALLRSRGDPFHLYLVGDGPLRKSLEARGGTLRLAGAVSFVGAQPHQQLPDWYRAADLTVLPSWSEGLPNVLRESLACGTPFVASQVGGIPEIANGTANCLVRPGDPVALADALVKGLAQRQPAGAVRSRSGDWAESAQALVATLAPIVAASQAADRPWWSGRTPALVAPDAPVNAWSWRQQLRRLLGAALPRRWFLTHGPRTSSSVCFTFDDGPHPEHTPRLLDVLRQFGVTATFFMVGRLAERYPDLVRRVAEEGHAVGNHSFLHPQLSQLSAREALQGTLRTQSLLTQLLGQPPTLYRPPRGKLGVRNLLDLWRHGLSVVLWNVDPRDYACRTAEEVAACFQRGPLAGGDIVLFHDRLPHALAVLPGLIDAARTRGLNFAPVSAWTR
jgi:peptidoglycan/xylan/chitin deacetylase (PgdA/CDA1 family)/glycosyltransferase involved in cell wall biosynthesis